MHGIEEPLLALIMLKDSLCSSPGRSRHRMRLLSRRDIINLARCSRLLYQIFIPLVYNNPDFGSSALTPFQSFHHLLDSFDPLRTQISLNSSSRSHYSFPNQFTKTIKVLDLSSIEETLFEEVRKDWLAVILSYCTNLAELLCRKTSFLTDAAVNLVTIFQLVSVVRLDVSFTENLSSKGLAKLVEFFPCLEKLNLEYCKGVSNMSLASLAAVTPCLTHLYLADAPINDSGFIQAMHASSPHWQNNLTHLHLTSCVRITDAIVPHFPRGLTHLHLSGCAKLTSNILTYLPSCLKSLDLTGLPYLSFIPISINFYSLAKLLGPTLKHLAVRLPAFYHPDMKIDLQDPFSSAPEGFGRVLQSLILTDVQESDPPTSHIITKIAGEWCKGLKRVVLVRGTFTSDHIKGMYSTVDVKSFAIDDAFVVRFNTLYGKKCRMDIFTDEEYLNSIYPN